MGRVDWVSSVALRLIGWILYVGTNNRHQTLTYELGGIDPRCSTTRRLKQGACSIRIHEGEDCIAAGKPLWVLGKNKDDPWNEVRYYAKGDKTWAKKVTVYTGLPMSKVVYRTVVIYDYDGKRISCSKLYPVTKLVAPNIHVYPGSSTALDVKGRIKLTTRAYKQEIAYGLSGVDALCSGIGAEPYYGCGIVVHEGSSCSEPGKVFWDKASKKKNPWSDVRYVAGRRQKARGRKGVHTGWNLADMVGRVVVIYDFNGNAVACSQMKPPRSFLSELRPVCKPKPPAPGPACRKDKSAECFPDDALVQFSQSGKHPLHQATVGDRALTQKASGELSFDNVLGFIHRLGPAESESLLMIEHELGSFRATLQHMIFADSGDVALHKLLVGQRLTVVRGAARSTVRVFSVSKVPSIVGLMSPLTESGSLIVDGVLASTYAAAYGGSVKHAAMHASFYALRVPSMFGSRGALMLGKLPLAHFLLRLPYAVGPFKTA
eukprot:TRINITY_DN795_c0_g1_i1.p1 TRINITY_DN795_c0_g1~~TRINITY_DN795_c0_g1_i1.p1  ORF type:complete len:490 (+),score=54.86 TRINITY_DN795_c0_g1_i1:1702-3171(+)